MDLFGRTEERQTERALIEEYKDTVNELLVSLNTQNHGLAVNVAKVPEQIKGFGHVKEKHIEAAMLQWQNNLDQFRKSI